MTSETIIKMKQKLLIALSAVLLLAAASCNKAGKTGLLIPKDAGMVLYIDNESLSSKLSWEEIKQTSWYKKGLQEAHDSLTTRLMSDPASSGIDTKKGFAFYFKRQGRGNYFAFQGNIRDFAAFENTVKQANMAEASAPEKKGEITFIRLKEDKGILGWNSSKFLLLTNAPDMSKSTGGIYSQSFGPDSLVSFAQQTFALKGSALLDDNPRFADLIKSKGDVHFWMNSEKLYGEGLGGGLMNMMKISSLLEGNVSTATLNFENGKIAVSGIQHYGKELTKIFDKYAGTSVSKETIGRLPNTDVIFAGVYNFPVAALVEMVRLIGADGLANMVLGQKGLSLDDIAKAFKGDMAFALTDVQPVADSLAGHTKPDAQYVFGASINNQQAFDKLYSMVNEEIKAKPGSVFIRNEKNWLVIGSSEAVTGSFLAGNNNPSYADKLSGHTFAAYVNIQRALSSFSREVSADSTGKIIFDLSLATWQDALIQSDYKKGKTSYSMDINLVDKSTNSLKQLNSYVDRISALRIAEQDKYHDNVIFNKSDSTDEVIPPPVR